MQPALGLLDLLWEINLNERVDWSWHNHYDYHNTILSTRWPAGHDQNWQKVLPLTDSSWQYVFEHILEVWFIMVHWFIETTCKMNISSWHHPLWVPQYNIEHWPSGKVQTNSQSQLSTLPYLKVEYQLLYQFAKKRKNLRSIIVCNKTFAPVCQNTNDATQHTWITINVSDVAYCWVPSRSMYILINGGIATLVFGVWGVIKLEVDGYLEKYVCGLLCVDRNLKTHIYGFAYHCTRF